MNIQSAMEGFKKWTEEYGLKNEPNYSFETRLDCMAAWMSAKEDNWKPSGVDYDRSIHTNPDHYAWADLFLQTFPNCGADRDTMAGWFANAMMAKYDSVIRPDIPSTESLKHVLAAARYGVRVARNRNASEALAWNNPIVDIEEWLERRS